jgi:hypothetical protein
MVNDFLKNFNMKRYVSFLLFFIAVEHTSGQIQFTFQNKAGSDMFVQGTELFRDGDFKGADSLYTMALCTYKDENVYFNRAVARLYQTDTLGSCADLNVAANKYFDVEASRLYHQFCCKYVDTIFYDNKFNPSDRTHFRYYEVILKTKFSGETSGTFHDKRVSNKVLSIDFGCDNNLLNLGTRTTDIIGSYIHIDSVKFFNVATESVSCLFENEYDDLKRRGQIALATKYDSIKRENKLEVLNVYFEIKVSQAGDILGVKYIGTHPKIELGMIENDLEKDMISLVNHYPKLTPALFHGEKVNFITHDFISF